MRDRISFFSSWYETLKVLPEEQRLPFLEAILAYGFEGIVPSFIDPMMHAVWLNIRPILDSSNAHIDGGAKGGARSKKATLQATLQATSTSYLNKLPSEATLASHPSKDKDKERDKEMDKEVEEDNSPLPPKGEVPYGTKISDSAHAKSKKEPAIVKFAPPTVEEVQAYLAEKGVTDVDAEAFVAFYESNGWMVGRNPMKSWRAAITTWRRKGYGSRKQTMRKPSPYGDMTIGTPLQRYEVPDMPAWE